jgi:hypothetical protein
MPYLIKTCFTSLMLFFIFSFSSCEDDSNERPASQPNPNAPTALEGSWLLQNIPTGSRLSFSGNVFTINSGTVIITGNFTYIGTSFNGTVTGRSGAYSNALSPDNFTGIAEVYGDSIVTFTNFSGNWYDVFSTWYGKN